MPSLAAYPPAQKYPFIGVAPIGKNSGARACVWALHIHDGGQVTGKFFFDVLPSFPRPSREWLWQRDRSG
ncbi:MAG: hypothetical protein KKI01_06665 [Proteobacteria bacterium]|nr:hypothetical protein [Pseudomonadota bacterium]